MRGVRQLSIADGGNNRERKVSTNGIITTIAGNGTQGHAGGGGPATKADLKKSFGSSRSIELGEDAPPDSGGRRGRSGRFLGTLGFTMTL